MFVYGLLKPGLRLYHVAEPYVTRAVQARASGRLYDAIRAVDLVRPTDPLRADADKLKAAIQRELLAHAQTVPAPPSAP